MIFKLELHPPSGEPFRAEVDESNNWHVEGPRGDLIAALLRGLEEIQVERQGGVPAHPADGQDYARAIIRLWPESRLLNPPRPPRERRGDGEQIIY